MENVNEKIGTPVKVTDPNSWGIPNINADGQHLNSFGNDANGPFTIDNKVYQVVDNFSWIAGKHSFRFGGEYRYNQFLQIGNEFARGRFTANGSFTGNAQHTGRRLHRRGLPAGRIQHDRERGGAGQGRFPQQRMGPLHRRHLQGDAAPDGQLGPALGGAQPLLDNSACSRTSSSSSRCRLSPTSRIRASIRSTSAPAAATSTRTSTFRFTGPVQLARDGRWATG